MDKILRVAAVNIIFDEIKNEISSNSILYNLLFVSQPFLIQCSNTTFHELSEYNKNDTICSIIAEVIN